MCLTSGNSSTGQVGPLQKLIFTFTYKYALLLVLQRPTLSLMTKFYHIYYVAAIPDGHAIFVDLESKRGNFLVQRVDKQGNRRQWLKKCTCKIGGILAMGDYVYLVHDYGVSKYNYKSMSGGTYYLINHNGSMRNTGSLASDPSMIPDQDQLLLVDKENVYSYKLSTREMTIRLGGLMSNPSSVSYAFYEKTMMYIVCMTSAHRIEIFDAKWNRTRIIGGYGSSDGQLKQPQAAIVSSYNTIIVADYDNNRLSEFRMEGQFVPQILNSSDGIYKPKALSFWSPYLWVVHRRRRLYRYKFEMLNVNMY